MFFLRIGTNETAFLSLQICTTVFESCVVPVYDTIIRCLFFTWYWQAADDRSNLAIKPPTRGRIDVFLE